MSHKGGGLTPAGMGALSIEERGLDNQDESRDGLLRGVEAFGILCYQS